MTTLNYETEQNTGISAPMLQEDVALVRRVDTAAGLRLTVALVVDGESTVGRGAEAARLQATRSTWSSGTANVFTNINRRRARLPRCTATRRN